jgi:hypothetical protein
MTVEELIKKLHEVNPKANVYIVVEQVMEPLFEVELPVGADYTTTSAIVLAD